MHEEHGPGQVPVELIELEVELLDAQQADADEVIRNVGYLVKTNNLLVELIAVASRVAAEHDHHRLAGLPRERLRRGQVGQPTLARRQPRGRRLSNRSGGNDEDE
jgi:hypothetical protein